MSNLMSVARRMRVVQRAHEQFLFRSLIDEEMIGPMLLDRLAADLLRRGWSRPDKSSMQSPMSNDDDH